MRKGLARRAQAFRTLDRTASGTLDLTPLTRFPAHLFDCLRAVFAKVGNSSVANERNVVKVVEELSCTEQGVSQDGLTALQSSVCLDLMRCHDHSAAPKQALRTHVHAENKHPHVRPRQPSLARLTLMHFSMMKVVVIASTAFSGESRRNTLAVSIR